MNKKVTISSCIRKILEDYPNGLTANEIYKKIIDRNLYVFGAKNPRGVVSQELRRHCIDIKIYTSYPIKYFKITGKNGNETVYSLIDTANIFPVETVPINDADATIEETLAHYLNKYNDSLKEQLLQNIRDNDPSFFEQLVVHLLMKMGYGYNEDAGFVVGKSHDGGIDGVINEDKLGLDKIYIQAKRYNTSNTIGRKELQSFVGAMLGVQKGVFITTSSFTKGAKTYVDSVKDKHIKLIDGILLTDLMLKYAIGVQTINQYTVYKIDEEFFN